MPVTISQSEQVKASPWGPILLFQAGLRNTRICGNQDVVILQERFHNLLELPSVHASERVGEEAARLAVAGIGGKQGPGGGALVHAARVRGRRTQGHGEEVAEAVFVTEAREGFGGEALEPSVRVLEGGAQAWQRGCSALAEPSQSLHGAIAGVAVLAIQHREQRGGEVAAALAERYSMMVEQSLIFVCRSQLLISDLMS